MVEAADNRDAAITLPRDLEAFFAEHRCCGEIDSEVTVPDPAWVVVWCSCGARLAQRVVMKS